MSSRTADHTDVLKTALHQGLDGVMVLGTEVRHYEKVRANASMPYYTNGRINMTDAPFAPGGSYQGRQDFEMQIDAYSRYDGDKEVDALRSTAVNVLMKTLTAPGAFSIRQRTLDNCFTIYEDEGEIRHGVIEVTLGMQIL